MIPRHPFGKGGGLRERKGEGRREKGKVEDVRSWIESVMMLTFPAARPFPRVLMSLRGACLAALALVVLAAAAHPQTATGSGPAWEPLFDGKTLTNWKPTKFFGEGPVTVENGQIVLASGNDLTGITWSGPPPP